MNEREFMLMSFYEMTKKDYLNWIKGHYIFVGQIIDVCLDDPDKFKKNFYKKYNQELDDFKFNAFVIYSLGMYNVLRMILGISGKHPKTDEFIDDLIGD